jgi:hypothetical protein
MGYKTATGTGSGGFDLTKFYHASAKVLPPKYPASIHSPGVPIANL